MVKSIIKEIIIMLLLCVAILLILGVLFYDYIPSNKVVPGKIAYSTPENIQEEVNEEVIDYSSSVATIISKKYIKGIIKEKQNLIILLDLNKVLLEKEEELVFERVE